MQPSSMKLLLENAGELSVDPKKINSVQKNPKHGTTPMYSESLSDIGSNTAVVCNESLLPGKYGEHSIKRWTTAQQSEVTDPELQSIFITVRAEFAPILE